MDKEMTYTPQKPAHSLTMEGRRRAALSGVTAVSCFSGQEIVLETDEGELALLGEGLNIEELNLEEGRLNVTGCICGLEYSERAHTAERRGFFRRKKK